MCAPERLRPEQFLKKFCGEGEGGACLLLLHNNTTRDGEQVKTNPLPPITTTCFHQLSTRHVQHSSTIHSPVCCRGAQSTDAATPHALFPPLGPGVIFFLAKPIERVGQSKDISIDDGGTRSTPERPWKGIGLATPRSCVYLLALDWCSPPLAREGSPKYPHTHTPRSGQEETDLPVDP